MADKGGKVVIIDGSLYTLKMRDFVAEGLMNHVYDKVITESTHDIATFIERKFERLRNEINTFLVNDKALNGKNLDFPSHLRAICLLIFIRLCKDSQNEFPYAAYHLSYEFPRQP